MLSDSRKSADDYRERGRPKRQLCEHAQLNELTEKKKKHFEKRQMLAEKQKSCAAYVHDCFLVSMGGKWVGLNNITRRKILSLNHVLVSLGVAAGDSNHHNSSSTPEERRRENMYVRVPLEYVLHIFDRRERKEKKETSV